MTNAQPSTITKSNSLNGSETITGGIIIMPSAIRAPLTTMSITRKGMNTMKPMMITAPDGQVLVASLKASGEPRRHGATH